LNMKGQALTAIDIETFAPSTSAALERLRPFSHDGEEHPAKPEIWRSAALRWLIDSLALAGAGMAGVYVSDLLDPSHVSANQTAGKTGRTGGFSTTTALQAGVSREEPSPGRDRLENGRPTPLRAVDREKQNHDEPRPKNIDASRRTATRAGIDTGR
jgi:hypothetical protein